MKKMILGLCALFACFVFASCGAGDPKENIANIEEATKKAENAKSASDLIDASKDGLNACIDFFKGDPTAEQVKDYKEKAQEFHAAVQKAAKDMDKDEQEKLKDAEKELDELAEKVEEAAKEWEKNHKDDKKEGEKEDKE